MKIAYLSHGTSVHTLKWTRQLVEAGLEVHLITQDELIDGIPEDVKIHRLPYRGRKGYFLNVPTLKKILKEIDADILHSNYASGYGTLGTMSGFKRHVISVWGDDVYQFPLRNPVNKILLKNNLRRAAAISSTSNAMTGETLKYCKKDIRLIPFGVDTDFFCPRTSAKEDVFKIGTAKYLQKQYGQETLIRGFGLFLSRLTESEKKNIELLVAGEGPDRQYYSNLAQELGIADRIKFVGRICQSKMPGFLSELDVFSNLSFFESFGVAIIEASSCGLPVIATDIGGIPEVVRNKETGFLIKPNDIQNFAEVLAKLKEDKNLRKNLGSNGREFVVRNFQLKECTNKMVQLYSEIASQR
jgi:glycosyltransferase involved in cell wall biosynthesis